MQETLRTRIEGLLRSIANEGIVTTGPFGEPIGRLAVSVSRQSAAADLLERIGSSEPQGGDLRDAWDLYNEVLRRDEPGWGHWAHVDDRGPFMWPDGGSAEDAGLVILQSSNPDEVGSVKRVRHETTIGSDASSGIAIADATLSPRHCTVFRCGERWLLRNHSPAGTFVNERLEQEVRLTTGDHVQVGNWVFRFLGPRGIHGQSVEAIYEAMAVDPVTGAWSERRFTEALSRELARSERVERPLAILHANLKGFRRINEEFGTLAGNRALRTVGQILRSGLGHEDLVARFRADDFFVLLPDTDRDTVESYVKSILERSQVRPVRVRKGSIAISLSIASILNDSSTTADALLEGVRSRRGDLR